MGAEAPGVAAVSHRTYLTAFMAMVAFVAPVSGLEPLLGMRGRLLLEETFAGDTLPRNWSVKSGRVQPVGGELRTSQSKGERLCLFHCDLPLQDAAIQVDFRFAGARGINVGLSPAPGESKKRGHLFSVMITPSMWNITQHQDRLDPKSQRTHLVSAADRFEQEKWYTLLVEAKGDDVVAQIDGLKPLRASHTDFRVKKPAIEFRVAGPAGGDACFDNLRVWELK